LISTIVLAGEIKNEITNSKSQIPNPPTGRQANHKFKAQNAKRLEFLIYYFEFGA